MLLKRNMASHFCQANPYRGFGKSGGSVLRRYAAADGLSSMFTDNNKSFESYSRITYLTKAEKINSDDGCTDIMESYK